MHTLSVVMYLFAAIFYTVSGYATMATVLIRVKGSKADFTPDLVFALFGHAFVALGYLIGGL